MMEDESIDMENDSEKIGERTRHTLSCDSKEPNHLNPAIFDCDTILVAGFKDLEEAPT